MGQKHPSCLQEKWTDRWLPTSSFARTAQQLVIGPELRKRLCRQAGDWRGVGKSARVSCLRRLALEPIKEFLICGVQDCVPDGLPSRCSSRQRDLKSGPQPLREDAHLG